MNKVKVAIVGSGNIGTDLLVKVMRTSEILEVGAFVGIDPTSDGLVRAGRIGIPTFTGGLTQLVKAKEFSDIKIVFDATSAKAHKAHDALLAGHGKILVDLTPAAIGPYTVPVINLEQHLNLPNINLVTCGGQATIPIVAAVKSVANEVHYAEIVSSISSKSAGPGTRANIDEFTHTTKMALEKVAGAKRAKAIIILNPAEPPLLMRNTIFTLSDGLEADIAVAIAEMAERVRAYVPGYRLKHAVQFERFGSNRPLAIPGFGQFTGVKSTVFLEVEGAAHYLPAYAGNLDIMTSAALAAGEKIARARFAA
jgi:acetaldehyde dehydrogenase